jgi:hypothetical protein
MASNPLDTFLLRRISDAEDRRPAPRRPANPVTGPSAAAPGNPQPPAPKAR